MAEGLLLGRGAVSPGMAIGGLPFVQAGNTALYLQLLWYPVAVRVVSLFCESVFAGSYLFLCVCISVSHVNLCCMPALSAAVCVCYMRVNLSQQLLPSPWCVAKQRMTQLEANSSPEPPGCNFHGKVMLTGHLCLFNPKAICWYLALGVGSGVSKQLYSGGCTSA